MDKGRNLAVALGERDVKVPTNRDVLSKTSASLNFVLLLFDGRKFVQADVKAKNKRERKVCNHHLTHHHLA